MLSRTQHPDLNHVWRWDKQVWSRRAVVARLGWRTCTLRGSQHRGYGHASFVVQQPSMHCHRLPSARSTRRAPSGHYKRFRNASARSAIPSYCTQWAIQPCIGDDEGIGARCVPQIQVPRRCPLNTEQLSHAGRQRNYMANMHRM